MILSRQTPRTVMEVWAPKYSTKHTTRDYVVLLAKYKVDSAAMHIVVRFTRAKHLRDKEFYISREKAQRFQLENNGSIPCYAVMLGAFSAVEEPSEVRAIALSLFEEGI